MTGRRPRDPIVETIDSPEVYELFASCLTRIEDHGATSTLVFGSQRRTPRGLIEVVAVRVVVPSDKVATISRQLTAGDCRWAAADDGDDEPARLAS